MKEDNEMNGVMEFFYQFGDKHPAVSFKLSPASDLSEALQAFEQFLRAAGYYFEGEIDIVKPDLVPQDENAELN